MQGKKFKNPAPNVTYQYQTQQSEHANRYNVTNYTPYVLHVAIGEYVDVLSVIDNAVVAVLPYQTLMIAANIAYQAADALTFILDDSVVVNTLPQPVGAQTFVMFTELGPDENVSGTLFSSLGASTSLIPDNPSALVGLMPANGVLNRYMRSDAAPALDQSISPNWAGMHTFNRGTAVTHDAPFQLSQYADQAVRYLNADLLDGHHWGEIPVVQFDNPTAKVGLTTINGSMFTAMRSDAAPAIDITIFNTVQIYACTSVLNLTNAYTDLSGLTTGSFTPTVNEYALVAFTLAVNIAAGTAVCNVGDLIRGRINLVYGGVDHEQAPVTGFVPASTAAGGTPFTSGFITATEFLLIPLTVGITYTMKMQAQNYYGSRGQAGTACQMMVWRIPR